MLERITSLGADEDAIRSLARSGLLNGWVEAAQWWPFGPMVTVLKLRGVPRARARGGELNTRWPLRAIGYVQLGVYAKVNARQCMRC